MKFKNLIQKFKEFKPLQLNKDLPPIIINSIPKAGTNLLLSAIAKGTDYKRSFRKTINESNLKSDYVLKNGKTYFMHLNFSNFNKIKITSGKPPIKILIIRDPRDILISLIDYINKIDNNHYLKNRIKEKVPVKQFEEILNLKNYNYLGTSTFVQEISGFEGFLENSDWIVIKYEDLLYEQHTNQGIELPFIKNVNGDKINISKLNSRTKNIAKSHRYKDFFEDKTIENFPDLSELTRKFGYTE